MSARHPLPGRIVTIIVLLLLTACGGTSPAQEAAATPVPAAPAASPTTPATAAPPATATPAATATTAATATAAPTDAPAVDMDDEQRSETGGYSFQPPQGWEATSLGNVTIMRPADTQDDNAPTFVLEGGSGEGLIMTDTTDIKTSDELLDMVVRSMSDDTSASEAAERSDVTVDGVDGRSALIKFVDDDEQLAGRAVAVFGGPNERLVFIGAGREEEWDATAPTYAAVLATIKLFEPEPEPEPTPEPSPTPPPPGGSRSDALPLGTAVRFTTWAVTVTDALRGEAAATAINEANEFNDPPGDGMEYVLLTVQVANILTDQTSAEVGYGVMMQATGSSNRVYDRAPVSLPQLLDGELFPGGQIEGQVAFAIPVDETNLMVRVAESPPVDDAQYFIAIDEGAMVTPSADLAGLEQSTEDGAQKEAPVTIGDTVRSDGWEATLLEYKRGAEAISFLETAAEYADAAPEGKEYVVVRMRVRNIASDKPDTAQSVDNSFLKIVGEHNEVYDSEFTSVEPRLSAALYPGAQNEGWVLLQVEKDEQDLIIIFQPFFSFDDEDRRFIALEE